MPLDLSRNYALLVDGFVERGNRLLSAGDGDAASLAYRRAAESLVRWADMAPTRDMETARRRRALEFFERAKRAAEPASPSPRGAAPSHDGRDLRNPTQDETQTPGRRAGALPGSALRDAVAAMVCSAPVSFDDIGGLDDVKDQLRYALALSLALPPEGVVLPVMRNVLLYGPPGTGKTLLAAATSRLLSGMQEALSRKDPLAEQGCASEPGDGEGRKTEIAAGSPAAFFNVKVSGLLSKYFGESSRLVSELYGAARDSAPSVVFLDEFEALAPSRDVEQSGAERRLLSTVLAELDGLAEKGRPELFVLTIAATNRPWDLDDAVLSRFQKRVCVPMPNEETRRGILEKLVSGRGIATEFMLEELAARTEGFSGRDLEQLVSDAVLAVVRERNAHLARLLEDDPAGVTRTRVQWRPLRWTDIEPVLELRSPTVAPGAMDRYRRWAESPETT